MDMQFVNPKKMERLEDYALAIYMSIFSLKTLESYQLIALKKGFLSEEESEAAKTIIWEIKRTINLLEKNLANISERLPEDLNQERIFSNFTGQIVTKAQEIVKKSKRKGPKE